MSVCIPLLALSDGSGINKYVAQYIGATLTLCPLNIPTSISTPPEPAFPRDKIRPSNTLSFPRPMNLVINDESRDFPAPLSVAALLETLGYAGKRIAVERNGEIVPRSRHAGVVLSEGDRIEIVVAVGGG